MSKFGVGVGDDFPVDDGSGQGGDQAQDSNKRDDRADYEEWKRRREAHRARRAQYQAQREEWRNRKHAFKEKVRAAARETFGQDWEDRRGGRGFRRRGFGMPSGFPFYVVIPILAIVLFVALVAAIFKSPFVFLALALIAFFLFGQRHHRMADQGRGRGGYARDYDFEAKPSRGPQPPQPTVVVTPPPQDGGS